MNVIKKKKQNLKIAKNIIKEKKDKPLHKRPTLWQKKFCKQLKKNIKKQSKEIGTKHFYTHYMSFSTDDESTWLDFCFLSKKHKNIYYNAYISTSMSDIIDEIFFDEDIYKSKTEDVINKHTNKISEIIKSYSNGFIKKDFTYKRGIGLDIRIANKDYITKNDIDKIIEYFLDNEEEDIFDENIVGNLKDFDITILNLQSYDSNNKPINKYEKITIPKTENINNIIDYVIYSCVHHKIIL